MRHPRGHMDFVPLMNLSLQELQGEARVLSGRCQSTEVFSRAALDELLWAADADLITDCTLSTPEGRRTFPRRAGTTVRDWASDGFVNGASVLIERLERHVAPVARLATHLSDALDAEVAVSAVLTPPDSAAFRWHYDAEEILVLQLEGEKCWQWHPPVRTHCTQYEQVEDDALPADRRSANLNPGDLLYLPRGTVHRAQAGAAATLQLTIAIRPYRWLDLLQDMLTSVALRDPYLRGRAGDADLTEALAHFRRGASDALAQVPDLRSWQSAGSAWPLPGGPLTGHYAKVKDSDRVRKPFGMRCHVRESGAEVYFDYAGYRVASLRAPAFAAPALRFIAAQCGAFSVHDLPDDLPLEAKRTLIKRLVHDGALEFSP